MSGKSKGLLLVLDGHNDLVTASTVPDYFQVLLILLETFQIITKDHYPFVAGLGGNN